MGLMLIIGLLSYFSVVFFFFKYGTLHEFACHPCAGAMLIFSVSFQPQYCAAEASTMFFFFFNRV